MQNKNEKTHFGYQSIKKEEKVQKVGEVFTSVASKYDLMNDLMSLGVHRLWKNYTAAVSGVRAGHKVLDLAGGTGDLTKLFSKRVGESGKVYLVDINNEMIKTGRAKLLDEGVFSNVTFIQANAEHLPFKDNFFDCISIGFGLRNVTEKQQALNSMYKACKPGGKIMVLEFSEPKLPGLKQAYDWYSFNILPKLGKFIANDRDSYQYLAESIRMHPGQDELKEMIGIAGFSDCYYHNLAGGIVALHIAHKY